MEEFHNTNLFKAHHPSNNALGSFFHYFLLFLPLKETKSKQPSQSFCLSIHFKTNTLCGRRKFVVAFVGFVKCTQFEPTKQFIAHIKLSNKILLISIHLVLTITQIGRHLQPVVEETCRYIHTHAHIFKRAILRLLVGTNAPIMVERTRKERIQAFC